MQKVSFNTKHKDSDNDVIMKKLKGLKDNVLDKTVRHFQVLDIDSVKNNEKQKSKTNIFDKQVRYVSSTDGNSEKNDNTNKIGDSKDRHNDGSTK